MNITIHGVDITLTQEQIKAIQAKLSPQPTAEDFLREILAKPFEVILGEGYIAYYQNNQWIFQQDLKNKYLWVNYANIWKVLGDKFKLKYDKIQQLIKDVVGEALNCKELTPRIGYGSKQLPVGEALNCKELTPVFDTGV